MSQYDGPSIFRKSQEKQKETKTNNSEKQQVSFENEYKKKLPKNIQTRTDIQKEVQKHMHTSPTQSVKQDKPANHRFKSKYIPPSLQQRQENKIQEKNDWLFSELEKRLAKNPASYLLFADRLADSYKEKQHYKSSKQKENRNKKKKAEKSRHHLKKEEKAKKIKREMKQNKIKPTSALHRSFSNIIEEEQAFLKNSEEKLNSLFSEKKRN